jgi:Gas vesicle protein
MRNNGPVASSPRSSRNVVSAPGGTNLGDLLELVLDKGLVIAGDITLFLGGVQLLTLKIRLLIASIDKAQEIGINWWQSDPALSSRASARAKDLEHAEQERNLLTERLDRLERLLPAPPHEADQEPAAGQPSNATPANVLDKKGRVIAGLKQPVQQAQEAEPPQAQEPEAEQNAVPASVLDQEGRMIAELKPSQEAEPPQAPERAPQPAAAQADQPAGAGPLLGQALQEHIARAMRPVLEELPQRSAQARQPVEQGRPAGQGGEEQAQE